MTVRRDLLVAKWGEAKADAFLAEEGRQFAIEEAQRRRESEAAMLETLANRIKPPVTTEPSGAIVDTAAADTAVTAVRGVDMPKAAGREAHTLTGRAGPLDAVIKKARASATDPEDHIAVWFALVALAELSPAPLPLMGYVEGEGVKYRHEGRGGSGVAFLTRAAFYKRAKRMGFDGPLTPAKSRQNP